MSVFIATVSATINNNLIMGSISKIGMTRRAWLGSSMALCGLAVLGARASLPTRKLSEDDIKVLTMLDEVLPELKRAPKEKETVQLLQIFRNHFATNGEVRKDSSPAMTLYNFYDKDSKIVVDKMIPVLQLDIVNAYWNNRRNSRFVSPAYITKSFASLCLKEAVYFDEYESNPEFVAKKLGIDEEFHQQFTRAQQELPKGISEKEKFIQLARNSKLLEDAKHYIDLQTHWEYIGYKTQLEFLHRQGYTLNSLRYMRQNHLINQDPNLRNALMAQLERLAHISPNGKANELGMKKSIIRDMFISSHYSPTFESLKNAFHIVLATHPSYIKTNDLRDQVNLILDKKYWQS